MAGKKRTGPIVTARGWPLVGWFLVAVLFGSTASAQGVVEDLGPGVQRWFADADARAATPPSVALLPGSRAREARVVAAGDVPGSGVIPEFRRALGDRWAVAVAVVEGTTLYGTGEAAGPLVRNGRRNVAWNHDAYGWGWQSSMLYKSIPWVLAVRADGTAYGVLADTPERVLVDTTHQILFVADGPRFPVVVVEGDGPAEVVRRLAALTGTPPLPPLWALGYHQSRYSYTPDDRVLEIAREFRRRRLPADVVWLDIDYMDRRRSFTWNPDDFDDPVALHDSLHALGMRSIAILDPGIVVDPEDPTYVSGSAADVWVRHPDGAAYVGVVWPGDCVFPDFTREDVRRWWGDRVGAFVASGVDGLWNDMNEPAVFRVASKTMPLDVVHRADADLGGTGSHARYHNVYGREMSRATFEGLRRARPDRRPFVLTRASHTGGQRWAATWSGDNSADWAHLDMSISVALNMGLSAWPWSGPDIGGFRGSGGAEFFARWIGIGALLPFARGHTEKGTAAKEPWSFGPAVEATSRRALERRYRLLPYLYHLAWVSSRTGDPIVRPVFFVDPTDPTLRDYDDGFLLGPDLLVVAATSPEAEPRIPASLAHWPRIDLGVDDADDPDLPRLHLRPGAVLPLAPVSAHTTDAIWEELELVVAPRDGVDAVAELYEDQGDGYGHLDENGARHRVCEVRVRSHGDRDEVRWIRTSGNLPARTDVPVVRRVRR